MNAGPPHARYDRARGRRACLAGSATKAGRCLRWRWRALSAAVVALVPLGARADRWLMEDGVNARFESNDNFALVPMSPGAVHTLYVTGALDVSRQLENAVTRLKTDATAVRQQGAVAQNRMDGQLALTQSLSDPLNTFSLALRYAQDFNNTATSADVTQGQGRRRTTTLSAVWSRALSERLSASTQVTTDRTSYGAQLASAVGYRDTAVSARLSYGWSETMNLGLQASHSEYRADDDLNRSRTDSVTLSLSRPLSDRASGSISVGVYRTATMAQSPRLACPLAASFCDAGLVPFVVVGQRSDTSRNGVQFDGSYRWQIDETTDSSFSMARQQAPSGAGTLVRSDTVSLGVNRSLSPTLTGSMNFARSRSVFQDATNAPSPGRSMLAVSLTKQFAPDLSVQASYQHNRADASTFASGARSNSLSVSLNYGGPRIDASR